MKKCEMPTCLETIDEDLWDFCHDCREKNGQYAVYPNCKKCGASHGMGIETTSMGKIEPLDMCNKCLWTHTRRKLNATN
jgi:hypothetical protein